MKKRNQFVHQWNQWIFSVDHDNASNHYDPDDHDDPTNHNDPANHDNSAYQDDSACHDDFVNHEDSTNHDDSANHDDSTNHADSAIDTTLDLLFLYFVQKCFDKSSLEIYKFLFTLTLLQITIS